ncbi:hypothetical protein U1Q18_008219 [Sarracenia purpurea var. burkii]
MIAIGADFWGKGIMTAALKMAISSVFMEVPYLVRVEGMVEEENKRSQRVDFRGDLFGMLSAHPLAPLLSLHHLDVAEPIFPNCTQSQALEHLFKALNVDPGRVLQQTLYATVLAAKCCRFVVLGAVPGFVDQVRASLVYYLGHVVSWVHDVI